MTTNNCGNNNCNKPTSHLSFFVAMFAVVALGGGAYLYLDHTVFGPIEMQEQTAQQNPGVPHPPKTKMGSAKAQRPDPKTSAAADSH